MTLVIKKGKIHILDCDINVAHSCNLSCQGCNHLSPILKKYYVEPAKVFEEFSVLGKYCHIETINLLGGEPLLHPDLIKVIDAVRSSEASERVEIVTNGLLLWRMPDVFWEKIDDIKLSSYPGREMSDEHFELCRQKARLYNVDLKVDRKVYFREPYSEIGTRNKSLIQRIYNTCQMAHGWKCYTVADGYFYKCPLGFFLPQELNNSDLSDPTIDGLEIVDSENFARDLAAYLESPIPLACCQYCLGTVGKLSAHNQISRKNWRNPYQHTASEDLIDFDYLQILEQPPHGETVEEIREMWDQPLILESMYGKNRNKAQEIPSTLPEIIASTE